MALDTDRSAGDAVILRRNHFNVIALALVAFIAGAWLGLAIKRRPSLPGALDFLERPEPEYRAHDLRFSQAFRDLENATLGKNGPKQLQGRVSKAEVPMPQVRRRPHFSYAPNPWQGPSRQAASNSADRLVSRGSSASNSWRRREALLGLAAAGAIAVPRPEGAAAQTVRQNEEATISLFQAATPSVVYISTFDRRQAEGFTLNAMEIPQGAGSGFVWDKEGHIVTNFHVIRNSEAAQITLTDQNGKQTEYPGKLRGFDVDKDIAVLKVDIDKSEEIKAKASKLRPIPVERKKKVRVGQTALAIGNPFGLDHTLTVGVISGTGRELPSMSGRIIQNVIQTDAAINPGNSGGPLLNSEGNLIGMNTAIYSPSGGFSGVGFAIPADTLQQVVTSIIEQGRVIRPALGIGFLESRQSRAFGIKNGVLILDVPAGSAASKSGLRGTQETPGGLLKLGDIVINIDGTDINDEKDLFKVLDTKDVGQTVTLKALRTETTSTNDANSSGSNDLGDYVDEIKRYKIEVRLVLQERPDLASMKSNINRELPQTP